MSELAKLPAVDDDDEPTDDDLADAMREEHDLLNRIAIMLDHDNPLRRACGDLAGALHLRVGTHPAPGPPRGAPSPRRPRGADGKRHDE